MGRAIILLSLLFVLALSLSCDRRGYTVEGVVAHGYFNGDSVYVKSLSNDVPAVVASGVVERGRFMLSGSADSVYMAMLYVSQTPVVPLVLEPGRITVSLENGGVSVGGTPLNAGLASFLAVKDSIDTYLAGILRKEARMLIDGVLADEARYVIEREFGDAVNSAEMYVDSFVRSHHDDVLGPFVFGLYCSGMNYDMLPLRMKSLLDDSPEIFRRNPFLKPFSSTYDR